MFNDHRFPRVEAQSESLPLRVDAQEKESTGKLEDSKTVVLTDQWLWTLKTGNESQFLDLSFSMNIIPPIGVSQVQILMTDLAYIAEREKLDLRLESSSEQVKKILTISGCPYKDYEIEGFMGIQILPGSETRLNRLAQGLANNHGGAKLFFNPDLLSELKANGRSIQGYPNRGIVIGIGDLLNPDCRPLPFQSSLAHEAMHQVEVTKRSKGIYSPYSGECKITFDAQRFSEISLEEPTIRRKDIERISRRLDSLASNDPTRVAFHEAIAMRLPNFTAHLQNAKFAVDQMIEQVQVQLGEKGFFRRLVDRFNPGATFDFYFTEGTDILSVDFKRSFKEQGSVLMTVCLNDTSPTVDNKTWWNKLKYQLYDLRGCYAEDERLVRDIVTKLS